MTEATATPEIQNAIHSAHVERARAFTAMFSWVFKARLFAVEPVGCPEPSR